MPREMYLISERPVGLAELAAAGSPIAPDLGLRQLFEGVALQMVDTDDVAVLTLETSRMVTDAGELRRVSPGLDVSRVSGWITVDPGFTLDDAGERLVPVADGPGSAGPVDGDGSWRCWWTEATSPWGGAGETGVEIMRALATQLGGALVVEDGT